MEELQQRVTALEEKVAKIEAQLARVVEVLTRVSREAEFLNPDPG